MQDKQVSIDFRRKIIGIFSSILLLTIFIFSSSSVKAEENFHVNAKAAIAVDAKSGKILYEQNADETLPIASMTKLLSLYLVFEAIDQQKIKWDDPVPISDYLYTLSTKSGLSNVPLSAENTYTVKDLVNASAIASANAATIALGDKVAGNETAFVDLMRAKLKSWGITDAHIVSISGLNNEDLDGHIYPGSDPKDENKLSAKDMAIVAQHIINDYPKILEITKKTSETFAKDSKAPTEMKTWNLMLPNEKYYLAGVDGLKTGTTDAAGACFTGTIQKNGWRLITVVMNAKSTDPTVGGEARFVETKNLMNYIDQNWEPKVLYKKGSSLSQIKPLAVNKGKNTTVPLILNENVTAFVRKDMDQAKVKVSFKKERAQFTAPLEKHAAVGKATIQLTDDIYGYIGQNRAPTYSIVTAKETPKANFFVLTGRAIKDFFTSLF